MLSFQRSRHFAVQRDALASEKLRVDGLSRQRVAERETFGRLLHDELGRNQLLHERKQFLLVAVRERLQQSEVEATSCNGGG